MNTFYSPLILLLFILICLPGTPRAQTCNCKYTVPLTQSSLDARSMNILPGDVICFQAGNRGGIWIANFTGTPEKPIVFKNCGGLVNISTGTGGNGIYFSNCKNFRLTGTGSSSFRYGFKIAATKDGANSLVVSDLSTDVEIDHVEIPSAGYAGIVVKTDPRCNLSANRGYFTMYNVSVHDNYVHDTKGEGLYIGNSFYYGYSNNSGCSGKVLYPHDIKGMKVYNNIIKRTGTEAIQVGCATEGSEVYNNLVEDYGQDPWGNYQNNGIQIGKGTGGKLYNNTIKRGPGNGVIILGIGSLSAYNNLIVTPGESGFFCANGSSSVTGPGYSFINNTIISPKGDGFGLQGNNVTINNVFNNIVINAGSGKYINKILSTVNIAESNNIFEPVVSNLKFVNAAGGDYHLLAASPAVNKGRDVSTFGVTLDLDGKPRSSGGATDIGAYESLGGNLPPVSNAGPDITVVLPVAELRLTGTGTDPDGSIAAFNWTKTSGPVVAISGASSQTLVLSSLQPGSYAFSLKVTDNLGASATDLVNITIIDNTAPVVNAGSDVTVTLPVTTATLTGTASDKDGSIASLNWTKLSGPSATLTGASTHVLSLSGLVQGTYVFRFQATDDKGKRSYDDVTLTVLQAAAANLLPVANAGPNVKLYLPQNSATIKGSGTDKDGLIAEYIWKKVRGPVVAMSNANTPNLNLSGLVAGTYVFRLTVKDNQGAIDTDDMLLAVSTITLSASSASAAGFAETGEGTPVVFPIPAKNFLTVRTKSVEDFIRVSLTDLSGKVIATLSSKMTDQIEVPFGDYNLRPGFYLLQIETTISTTKKKVLISGD